MPFTPFHLGPGALLKAVGGRRFGFAMFAATQVAMDLEVAIRIAAGAPPWHGPSHSYPGALLIGGVTLIAGRPAWKVLARAWNRRADPRIPRLVAELPFLPSLVGAALGVWSHVLIDGLLYPEIRPWYPRISRALGLGNFSFAEVYGGCLIAGILGLALLGARRLLAPARRFG
ncbi:MAG: hypothetical protein R3F20_13190 [Planctomycetota bacterium]